MNCSVWWGVASRESLPPSFFALRQVNVSARSSLYLVGPDITVGSLTLDGALVIRAVPGASVRAYGVAYHTAFMLK